MLGVILISLAPVVIIAVYIYIRDKYEREPAYMLVKGLLIGGIATFFVVITGLILQYLKPFEPRVVALLYDSFISAALNEETMKFAGFMIFIWGDRNFNENFDGIVYAVFISMGFAGVENILYVIDGGLATGIIRALTAVPAHALFGVLMGYFLSKAKFQLVKRKKYLLWALVIPVLCHGIYDMLLFSMNEPGMDWGIFILVLLFVLFVVFLYILGFRKINESVESSQFKDKPGNE